MKKLLLFLLALTCFACSAATEGEPVGSLDQRVGTGCVLFPWSDDAFSPPAGQSSGTRVEWRIVNIGDTACTSLTQVDLWKNGITYEGTTFSNASLAPAPNAATPTPSILRRQNFSQNAPCEYKVWIKYRNTQSSPNLWHDWGWTNCTGL